MLPYNYTKFNIDCMVKKGKGAGLPLLLEKLVAIQ
jgi:hypothetical protein